MDGVKKGGLWVGKGEGYGWKKEGGVMGGKRGMDKGGEKE
jgi:hypothetical protein